MIRPDSSESLPLIDISKNIGLTLSVKPGIGYYGYYSPSEKEIALCSDDEQTFLHELSHAIDNRLGKYDKSDPNGAEVVAELSACFLATLYCKKADMAFTKQYLKAYTNSGKDKVQFASILFKYLERVSMIYEHILSLMV